MIFVCDWFNVNKFPKQDDIMLVHKAPKQVSLCCGVTLYAYNRLEGDHVANLFYLKCLCFLESVPTMGYIFCIYSSGKMSLLLGHRRFIKYGHDRDWTLMSHAVYFSFLKHDKVVSYLFILICRQIHDFEEIWKFMSLYIFTSQFLHRQHLLTSRHLQSRFGLVVSRLQRSRLISC